MQPMPCRADGLGGTARRRTVHCAATMVTTSMIGVSINSAILVPRGGGDPERADSPKHEARSEYEREIEHASFQNRHNILLCLSAPTIGCLAKSSKDYHWI
jgi:hypothetical protein